ncbi:MAG TPA: DUF2341 domain-containing protein, partial [Chitinispirillaceae bacterium]|nr:DUF2341 domain-containing protein [Chitinispirillaceae bacterium]
MHCGILALLFLFATLNADDYGTWSNWRYVYLITNSNGAEVTGSTVTNFPVLIRFNPSNFDGLGSTSNSGADIRFAKTDGTHFPYAIERWTNYSTTNDTAEIWVLVDTIKPNDTTKIIMYWNRGGAVDSSSSEKVFSTSYGFQGVWHLGDSSGNVIDATNNSYDGTINGNQYRTAGRVAHAESYDGSGDYSEMANVLNMDYTSATTSFWVKRASIGSNQTIVAKSNGGNPNSIYGFVFSIDNANCVHM